MRMIDENKMSKLLVMALESNNNLKFFLRKFLNFKIKENSKEPVYLVYINWIKDNLGNNCECAI
jgi:hypothetical protein